MAELPRHSVSVAGIVLNDDGEILVIKRRDNGQWQPPGGILELNETIEEGVQREVLEETGVRVSAGLVTGVYKNMTLGTVALVVRCTNPVGEPQASDEAEQVQWMTIDRALELTPAVFAIRVRDAVAPEAGAPQRAHDGVTLIEKANG